MIPRARGCARGRFAALALLTACASVHTKVTTDETVTGRRDVVGKPERREATATLEATDATLAIVAAERDLCRSRTVEDVARKRTTKRTVSKGMVAAETILGLAFTGAGGYAAAAPDSAATTAEPIASFTTTEMRGTGATIAGLGVATLIVAIVDATRGGTSRKDLPPIEREVGDAREVDCGRRPLAGQALVITAGTRIAELGVTDAQGRIEVAWEAVSPALFEGADPPAEGTVRRADDAASAPLATVELIAPRRAVVERAWAAAQGAGTARAVHDFRKRFPAQHEDEVKARIVAGADDEYEAAIQAALGAGDVERARVLLADWAEVVPDSTRRAPLEANLEANARDARLVALIGDLDRDLAVAAGDLKNVIALATAAQAVTTMREAAPGDPRVAEAEGRLAAARAAKVKALVKAAKAAKASPDEAVVLADLAVEVDPEARGAVKMKAEARKRAARAIAKDARALARQGDLDAAEERLSAADALAPGDREVVAARKRIEKTRAAEEAKIADAAERERRAAERAAKEAERKAAREAEKQRKEEEKLARLEERKRKEEERRLAKEAAREAERLRKEEEKQRKEEERAAREAEKKRKADEKVAAREAEKQRKEADKLAAIEAEKRRQAELDARERAEARAAAAAERRRRAREAREARSAQGGGAVDLDLVGLWTASARAQGADVLLVLAMRDDGTGSLAVAGQTGRILGRQAVAWAVEGGKLVVDGDGGASLRGGVIRKGRALEWAGYRWTRVEEGHR